MAKKTGGIISLLTGMALGAASVFFSKKENRDKTEKLARKTVKRAKVEAKKATTKAKVAVRKAKVKGKKIAAKSKLKAKKTTKVASSKK